MAREQECIDVNECAESTDNCTDSRQCINTNGSYYCCNPGFARSTYPPSVPPLELVNSIAQLHPLALADGKRPASSPQFWDMWIFFQLSSLDACQGTNFFCLDEAGDNCTDVDECYLKRDNCTEANVCVNTEGSFYCCSPGTFSKPSRLVFPWLRSQTSLLFVVCPRHFSKPEPAFLRNTTLPLALVWYHPNGFFL